MKYTLDKLEQTLVATILAFCLILIFSIAGAVHFYTFRAGATAQIAELEKKIQDLEEAQRNVNGYFSRELSRTQGELWVAPRAGAWIETLNFARMKASMRSRPSCRGVD